MNYRGTVFYLGTILKTVCAFLLVPFLTALCYQEWNVLLPILYTAIIFIGVGFLLAPKRPKISKIGSKEGLIVVGLSWILVSLISALFYLFSGSISNYIDAFFETVSGFTTTGATILNEVESLPKSVLIWRSLTHWLGGMGILVFILAVLPTADGSAFELMKFDSPGPTVGKLVSKVRHSAAILYVIYLALTLLQAIILLFSGIGLFDAVNIAFSTAGTGGFSVRNASIASYNSLFVELVVIIFMFIFSINFNIWYLIAIRKFSTAFRDEEFHTYMVYIVLAILAVALGIVSSVGNFWEALRQSAFAVTTIASSTGFTTVDFAQWSELSKGLLTIVMFIGACAGSTGGGLKFSRIMVAVKTARSSLLSAIRPNSVHLVKLNKKALTKDETQGISGYFILFMLVIAASVLLLNICGYDFSVSFYTTLTTFNNIGPIMEPTIGATASCAAFNWGAKLVMICNMLIGRLEIFPILLLFSPKSWSKRF